MRDYEERNVGAVNPRAQANAIGRVKSVIFAASGKRIGTVEMTAEPDALGRVKTTFRDTSGRTTGTAVANGQPDALGRTTTVLRDAQGTSCLACVSVPLDHLGIKTSCSFAIIGN